MRSLALLALLGLAACPPEGNPPQLWLAPAGSDAAVTLADSEPDPF